MKSAGHNAPTKDMCIQCLKRSREAGYKYYRDCRAQWRDDGPFKKKLGSFRGECVLGAVLGLLRQVSKLENLQGDPS